MPFCKVKWQHFEGMWQILHASFWKFSKLSNSGISLNWSIIDEVTTGNTTAYFFDPLCIDQDREMENKGCLAALANNGCVTLDRYGQTGAAREMS